MAEDRRAEVEKLREELENDEDYMADRIERSVIGGRSSFVDDFFKLMLGEIRFTQIRDDGEIVE